MGNSTDADGVWNKIKQLSDNFLERIKELKYYDKVKGFGSNLPNQLKKSELPQKIFVSVGILIVAAIALIVGLSIIIEIIQLILTLPLIIIENIFENIDHFDKMSTGQRCISGIASYVLIALTILFISWLFTGSPPLISFFSRFICFLGISLGLFLLIDKGASAELIDIIDGNFHNSITPLLNNPIQLIAFSFGIGLFSELISGVHKSKKIS